jgi:hypothetical protein
MKPRWRVVASLLAVLVAGAGLAAVRWSDNPARPAAGIPGSSAQPTAGVPGSSARPTADAPGAVRQAGDIVLPLDAFTTARAARRTTSTAVSLLGRACMKGLGLDWPVPDRTPPAAEERDNARRYGLVDAAHARSHGYHRPPAEAAYTARVSAVSRTISDATLQAWTGDVARVGRAAVPAGGCAQEARRRLGAPPAGIADNLVDGLKQASMTQSAQDPQVGTALGRWSACMRAKGFTYNRPAQAERRYAGTGAEVTAPAQAEVATAVADVSCNHESDLAGIWLRVETALQRRVVQEKATELERYRRWQEQVVSEAARVTAALGQ